MTRLVIIALAVLVAILAVAAGGVFWYRSPTRGATDDAYVEGTIAPIAARVSGHVVELLVQDNQAVGRGDLLLRIDPRDYEARRDQARAAVGVAEAALRAARSEVPLARDVNRARVDEGQAALEGSRVAVRSSESAVAESRARIDARRAASAALTAEIASASAVRRKAERDLERARALMKHDYVARRELDDAESALETASAALEAAQRRLAQSEGEIQQAEAELAARVHAIEQSKQRVAEARGALARAEGQGHEVAVKLAEASRAEAQLRQARADLAMAELQLEHTAVRAPIDGVVSRRSVELGQVVQPGQPLLALVPLHEVWVVANFKETQLARVRPGMRAEIEIDGFPGKVFHGTVNSISAGTGARFSLLPPENATGNWVKVVQRVPVKIVLDDRSAGNPQPLRTGMSAYVTIRLR